MSYMDRVQKLNDNVWMVPGLFSHDECDQIVRIIESFDDSDWFAGRVGRQGVPIVDTAARFNFDLERHLYEPAGLGWTRDRILSLLHDIDEDMRIFEDVKGEPSFWTICRNDPGCFFRWHDDMDFEGLRTAIVLVYLSDQETHSLKGGETSFGLDHGARLTVTPQRGNAIIFNPRMRHKGHTVREGQKYVMLYAIQRVSPPQLSEENAQEGQSEQP